MPEPDIEPLETPAPPDDGAPKDIPAESPLIGDTQATIDGLADKNRAPQHHVAKILDEVLEEPTAGDGKKAYKHPLLLDLVLGMALLFAMGGFTVGLFNMYLTHQAQQSIMKRDYQAAITVLKGAPFIGLFSMSQDSPAELLNQAYYLDAMSKLDANGEDKSAITELEHIQAGSTFFNLAQEILKEHFKPSDTQLKGQTEHVATPAEAVPPKKPLLPPEEGDASP